MIPTIPLFIDGGYVPETDGLIEVINPSRTSALAGLCPLATPAIVDAAVESADAAYQVWSRTPVIDRCQILVRCIATAEQRVESIAQLMCAETGKPINDCRGEIRFAGVYARSVLREAPDMCAEDREDSPSGIVIVQPQPYGVVAALTPWNAPIILAVLKVLPAIATGNTVVVKPSPVAPLAVTAYLSAMAAQLPDGVLNIVVGDAPVGQALVEHPAVRKVAFTGGIEVGRRVATLAGHGPKPLVLELGGNDPAIILEDAPLDDSGFERLVLGSFLTSGQVCMAAKQVWVPRRMLDGFVERYVAAAERVLELGDAASESTTVGPVGTAESYERLSVDVPGAIPLGRVEVDSATGWYVRPQIVVDADPDSDLVTTEQFGPVVPIVAYDNPVEVIHRVNSSEYALASSVWSANIQYAVDVARQLRTGYTFINSHNRMGMSINAPFGGMRSSGYGREYGSWGIAEYLQTHTIHIPVAVQQGEYPA